MGADSMELDALVGTNKIALYNGWSSKFSTYLICEFSAGKMKT